MEKVDGRHASPEAQEEKRRIAFRMRSAGYKRGEIARLVGVNPGTVGDWFRVAREKGEAAAITGGRRGAKPGQKRTLNAKQALRIQGLLKTNMPDELGLSHALWTRRAVIELVRARCHTTLPLTTAGLYLKRWGFTPQKPAKQAYEQQPAAVQQWLDEDYPAIAARAKAEKGVIHWGDETGIKNQCQHGRSYSPRGETPIQKLPGKRLSLNMISTVTNQGLVRFMLYEEKFTAKVMIRFLERLVRGSKHKVFLIMDNLKVHHAHKIRDWLATRQEKIELFFLPSYSPELNPDEYLNCDFKAQVHSGKAARTKKQLKSKVKKAMKLLQKRPARVAKYFEHSSIAYAA
jgi:transposase